MQKPGFAMSSRLPFVPLLILLVPAMAVGQELSVDAGRFRAEIAEGELRSLVDAKGTVFVRPAGASGRITIHQGTDAATPAVIARAGAARARYTQFTGLEGAEAELTCTVPAGGGDLSVTQTCTSKTQGVWGVGWSIGTIPPDYAIIVPGRSGVRLDQSSPGDEHTFDYPLGWEAQLVIVEGPARGFCVWADDPVGRYKRLLVRRGPAGWQLQLITINDAPFDRLTACRSVVWRLDTYEGDWRVPARRYREWMAENFRPAPIATQQPAWVRDIRACVIMGPQRDVLEELPAKFDPKQTLIYVPSWRAAGYDRDYPDYEAVLPEFEPFLRRSRELGFRVMVHTNYFGVDPLNALYAKFEPFQVRSAWGTHAKQWWLWERAEPVIRFAYINPALRAWRELFVKAMVELCRRYPIDALHLDQTLCIYNDHNGRIDGLSMIEGNAALHRELRAALPQVALSGEGLNEITCRYEAFAQRHAWGLNHSEGTWVAPQLRCAHPISSYLFLPYTKIYGYLGYAPPETDQLYAAWNEAYEHWGVIPTLKPRAEAFGSPSGFTRQLFDETAFFQSRRLDPDMDGDWPDGVAFAFRTADGQRAVRTCDGRFTCQGRTISWTVRGVNRVESAGSVPGWRAYDERCLLGLDPDRWYPHFDDARDPTAFHVAQLAEGLIADEVLQTAELAVVRTRPVMKTVADLVRLIGQAVCGSTPGRGQPLETRGPLRGVDGSQFVATREQLEAHPAYKQGAGPAFARYTVRLPREGRLRFAGEIALGKGAMEPGRSDGVTFRVSAAAGAEQIRREVHHASEVPARLELDLTGLAGKEITLELMVHPGPGNQPSFDWARWHRPRVEQEARGEGPLAVAGVAGWSLALGPAGPMTVAAKGKRMVIPDARAGAICLLRDEPAPVAIPADLTARSRIVAAISDAGLVLDRAEHAGVAPGAATIGGRREAGLRAHPPDHGRSVAYLPMRLPTAPAVFRASIGIAGEKSAGVIFQVELNGQTLLRRPMLPRCWEDVEVDLRRWSGQPVVLSLTTDSDGPFNYDWAHWGRPRLETLPPAASLGRP